MAEEGWVPSGKGILTLNPEKNLSNSNNLFAIYEADEELIKLHSGRGLSVEGVGQ